jgi:hypothetical protein
MLTTFGASLLVTKWTKEMRDDVVARVMAWLDESHPHDTRTNKTRIAVRHSADDPVFRVEVLEPHPAVDAARGTTITAMSGRKGELIFDVRRTLRPTQPLVVPRPAAELPDVALSRLITGVAKAMRATDAQYPLVGSIIHADTSDDGAALAAFVLEAHSRRLPVVIECTSSRSGPAVIDTATATALAGVAHVAYLDTAAAETGFQQFHGGRLVSGTWTTVVWPRGTEPLLYHARDPEPLVTLLVQAAVAALPPLLLPSPRRAPAPTRTIEQQVAKSTSPEVDELRHERNQLRAEVQALREDYDSLIENLTTTEHLTAKAVDDRDRYRDQLTDLLTLRDSPEEWNDLRRVVSRAMTTFKNIVFHENVLDRLGKTQFNPVTHRRIFENLLELNNIAARLQRGDIAPHVLHTYCMDRFNYAPSVSDNAIQKFPEDYTIRWNDKDVLIGPHLRIGDARIHLYHDVATNTIVIGHIGRHLRDKSTT